MVSHDLSGSTTLLVGALLSGASCGFVYITLTAITTTAMYDHSTRWEEKEAKMEEKRDTKSMPIANSSWRSNQEEILSM
jgi:hypothetical protein